MAPHNLPTPSPSTLGPHQSTTTLSYAAPTWASALTPSETPTPTGSYTLSWPKALSCQDNESSKSQYNSPDGEAITVTMSEAPASETGSLEIPSDKKYARDSQDLYSPTRPTRSDYESNRPPPRSSPGGTGIWPGSTAGLIGTIIGGSLAATALIGGAFFPRQTWDGMKTCASQVTKCSRYLSQKLPLLSASPSEPFGSQVPNQLSSTNHHYRNADGVPQGSVYPARPQPVAFPQDIRSGWR